MVLRVIGGQWEVMWSQVVFGAGHSWENEIKVSRGSQVWCYVFINSIVSTIVWVTR